VSITVHTADGTPDAGDPEITDVTRRYADELGGYITDDDTGKILYDAR
jgi:hypothetical protein